VHKSVFPADVPPASWVVVKFGGTSVATHERWLYIEQIVRRHLAAERHVLLVCSALASVTNRLEGLAQAMASGEDLRPRRAELVGLHRELALAMNLDPTVVLRDELESLDALLGGLVSEPTPRDRALLLSHGELLASRLGEAFLARRGCDVARVDARELLIAQPGGQAAEHYLSASCGAATRPEARARLAATNARVVVTQGFIARDEAGETVLLGRGGSDASAAYLAAAIDAEAVEIWSDVPGLFTADPRVCPRARLLRRASYAEAETLGTLGARALHPHTIRPLRSRGIPLYLGATTSGELPGTRVTGARARPGVKAVAARHGLALVVMARPSSVQPVGFMAEVAARFQHRGFSMDLIASSASEIRATIDMAACPGREAQLAALVDDLRAVCRPRVLRGLGSVSLVGTDLPALGMLEQSWLAALAKAHVHLTAHAANGTHLTFVVEASEAADLVASAHHALVSSLAEGEELFGPSLAGPPAPAQRVAQVTDDSEEAA
jgi:diaminopimelate decarboxylase/aspartate kinase